MTRFHSKKLSLHINNQKYVCGICNRLRSILNVILESGKRKKKYVPGRFQHVQPVVKTLIDWPSPLSVTGF